jgi:hypothetical protein
VVLVKVVEQIWTSNMLLPVPTQAGKIAWTKEKKQKSKII